MTSSNFTPKEFLQAVLIDRFIPLSVEPLKIQERIEKLSKILDIFSQIHWPTDLTEENNRLKVSETISKIILAFEILQKQQNLEEAKTVYLKALELLIEGIKLDRGDEKKWPALTPSQKTIRLLANYFSSSPLRFLYEKEFRSFHAAMHLFAAKEYLNQNLLPQSEQEAIFAQEEIRHVIALCLQIELATIREEAETIAQTTGRAEREVTLELFDRFFSSKNKENSLVLEKLKDLIEKTDLSENLINRISHKVFGFKKISSLSSTDELLKNVKEHPQNLEVTLALEAEIDWQLFFQEIFHFPDSKTHPYFRMPDIDRYINLSIKNHDGKLLVQLDEQGRLIQAPTVQEIAKPSTSTVEKRNILDTIIIGAGPGGISAAVNLMGLGVFRYMVLERTAPNSTVRDIWSREKEADTFYSGPPDPIEGLVGMQDTTRAVFLNRMSSFIDYFHLNIHSSIRVDALHREKNLWILKTTSGEYLSRTVLMTAGRYGKPKLLKWEEGNLNEELRKHIVRGVEVDQIAHSTVLVIGGGNTAFDNVKTLISHGSGKKQNKVFLSYPKKPFNVPASMHAHNNDQLMQWEAEGKITLLWNSNSEKVEPIEEKSPDGQIKQRFKVFFREENIPPMIFDYIAPAVGWQIDKEIMEKAGVNFIDGRNPDVDLQTGQAYSINPNGERVPLEGLFIAGDYAVQKSVPAALTSNYRAAVNITHQLKRIKD